jgi:hypothetical protein
MVILHVLPGMSAGGVEMLALQIVRSSRLLAVNDVLNTDALSRELASDFQALLSSRYI